MLSEQLFTAEELAAELRADLKRGDQSEIARQAGFTPSLISQVVSGKIRLGLRLARALGYERVILYRRIKENACNRQDGGS